MKTDRSVVVAACFAVTVALATTATQVRASTLSGNPAADGWTELGNSLTVGTWLGDSGGPGYDVDFDVYRTQYTVGSDTYVGLGGVVVGAASDLESVMKFCTASESYKPPSSIGASDGIDGDAPGGDGMVLVRVSAVMTNPAGFLLWNGSAFVPMSSQDLSYVQYAFTSATESYVRNWGAPLTLTDNYLAAFEAVLDVTALQAEYGAMSPSANAGGSVSMQGNQPGDCTYNDAFVNPANTITHPAPAPEPVSTILFGTGLLAIGGYVARRKMAHTV